MPTLFPRITDLGVQSDVIRRRRYGVIESSAGRLAEVRFRPWPKLASLPEIRIMGRWHHRRLTGDRCWLYFNQPLTANNYLSLTYAVSSRDATLATFRGALCVLEEIAELKQSDAIICDIDNRKISDRLLARWGWEPLRCGRWHRQFIKRFYGDYSTRLKTSAATFSADAPRSTANVGWGACTRQRAELYRGISRRAITPLLLSDPPRLCYDPAAPKLCAGAAS